MMMPVVFNSNRSRTSAVSGYTTTNSTNDTRIWMLVLMFLACFFASPVYAFTVTQQQACSHERRHHGVVAGFATRQEGTATGKSIVNKPMMVLYATAASNNNNIMDAETDRLRARAHEVLKKSKAKLAAMEEQRLAAAASSSSTATTTSSSAAAGEEAAIPFFASATKVRPSSDKKRDAVTKSRDAITGLITTDGEKMAALSETEEWESRPLMQVFQNEMSAEQSSSSVASSSSAASRRLADRDVAASIFNLRQKLHQADYQRIFDKRNRFIGEDN